MISEATLQFGLFLLVLLFVGISYLRSRKKHRADQSPAPLKGDSESTAEGAKQSQEIFEHFGIDTSKKGIEADFLPIKNIIETVLSEGENSPAQRPPLQNPINNKQAPIRYKKAVTVRKER